MLQAIKISRTNSDETVILFINNPFQVTIGLPMFANKPQELLERIAASYGTLWLVPAFDSLEVELLPWRNDNETPKFHEAYRVYSYGAERVVIECIRHENYYSRDTIEAYDSLSEVIELFANN